MTAYAFNSPPNRARQRAERELSRINSAQERRAKELDIMERCKVLGMAEKTDASPAQIEKRDRRINYLKSLLDVTAG